MPVSFVDFIMNFIRFSAVVFRVECKGASGLVACCVVVFRVECKGARQMSPRSGR